MRLHLPDEWRERLLELLFARQKRDDNGVLRSSLSGAELFALVWLWRVRSFGFAGSRTAQAL